MTTAPDPKTRPSLDPVPDNWRLHAWSPSGEPPQRRLTVRACADVWGVDAEGLQPLSFASGAQAELQAHALAQGFAAAGFDASISVHDASQALIGTVMYHAHEVPLPSVRREQYPWMVRRRIGAPTVAPGFCRAAGSNKESR